MSFRSCNNLTCVGSWSPSPGISQPSRHWLSCILRTAQLWAYTEVMQCKWCRKELLNAVKSVTKLLIKSVAKLLIKSNSSSVCVMSRRSNYCRLIFMEEFVQNWVGHARMVSGWGSASGASWWKQAVWKRERILAMSLLGPVMCVIITWMSNFAAQKYNILSKTIASGDLEEPLHQILQMGWLSQWKRTIFCCQWLLHLLTAVALSIQYLSYNH